MFKEMYASLGLDFSHSICVTLIWKTYMLWLHGFRSFLVTLLPYCLSTIHMHVSNENRQRLQGKMYNFENALDEHVLLSKE